MKTDNVVLCDVCKNVVAKEKCLLCGNDLCKNRDCMVCDSIKVFERSWTLVFCKDCNWKINQEIFINDAYGQSVKENLRKDIWVQLEKLFIDNLKRKLITKKLKDGNK